VQTSWNEICIYAQLLLADQKVSTLKNVVFIIPICWKDCWSIFRCQ